MLVHHEVGRSNTFTDESNSILMLKRTLPTGGREEADAPVEEDDMMMRWSAVLDGWSVLPAPVDERLSAGVGFGDENLKSSVEDKSYNEPVEESPTDGELDADDDGAVDEYGVAPVDVDAGRPDSLVAVDAPVEPSMPVDESGEFVDESPVNDDGASPPVDAHGEAEDAGSGSDVDASVPDDEDPPDGESGVESLPIAPVELEAAGIPRPLLLLVLHAMGVARSEQLTNSDDVGVSVLNS